MSLYINPYSIHAIILIICVFAGNYARTDEHGVEIPLAIRYATHLGPFHHWFQGTRETDLPSVFPYPGSEQWDEVGANANFLEGCTYQMNVDAFPGAMTSIVARVESYPEAIRDDIIRETYNAGFFDGDGTLCGRVLALFTSLNIVIALAIKGVEIPYKKLLCKNGFTLDSDGDGVSRSLSTMDIFWYITWQEVLFIKRIQFNVMLLFGLALRLLGTFLSPLGWLVRAIVGPTLSALNYDHGALIPEEAYLQQLERLRTEYPLLFVLYIAGLMGADGNIGSNHIATQTILAQSNYPFLNALAQTSQRAFGFSDVPRVSFQERPGTRTRDTFNINFSAEQGEAMTLLVGSFDYNRRAQWLLTLIMRLIVSAPDFPNKTNIREFIEDILIVIREAEPS